jgi:hypothetical protein
LRTWSRHYLALFLSRFGCVFLALQVFVGVAALMGYLASHPYLPALQLLRRLPDLLLLFLPVSLPVAGLLGGVLFVAAARAGGGLLWAPLAGRDPRRFQMPILLFGAALAAVGCWLQAAVLPQASFRARNFVLDVSDAAEGQAVRMVAEPGLLGGLRIAFEDSDRGEMRGFCLFTRRGDEPLAIVCERATADLSPDGERLELALREGRILGLDADGHPRMDLAFGTFRLLLDAGRIGRVEKQDLLELEYYTNRELERLPAQEACLLRHGIRPRPRQARRVDGVAQVRASRIQMGILPLLFLGLVVAILGRDHRGSRWRVAAVVAVCLVLLLPQAVLLGNQAKEGRLPHPGLAFLPTAETALLLLLLPLLGALPFRRRT